MANARRPLKTEEYLETDDSGGLFWKGKKVKVGGITVAGVTLIVAIAVGIFGVLENYSSLKAGCKSFWADITGPTPNPAPPPPATPGDTPHR